MDSPAQPYNQDLSNSGPGMQPEPKRKEGERIALRWEQMTTLATNWLTHWQEIYENIVPRKEDVVASRVPGDRRNSDLFDTTAILANEMLASALHGMLTNPETKFFELTFGDPKLDELTEVKDWCQDVGDRMFRVLNNTNFMTEIYEVYIDLGAIGTACLYMGEHDENVVHFSARAMKEIRVDENNLGVIDVVYRMFKWRPLQIVQEFGEENCPPDVIRAVETNSTDQMEILHAVEPMDQTERGGDSAKAKGFKYKSTYVLKNSKWIFKQSGYRTFPYAVPRWSKTTGEIYGRGPGMSMLPDVLMVNAMMLTVIQGAQKTVDPPLMVTDDGVIGVVRLTPGGLTIVRPSAGGEPSIKPLITDARVDFGQKMVEDVRSRIRAGFYIDQLQMQEGPQKTAEEVRQSTEDKMRLMGPVLGRQHWELLKPLIERLFDIMVQKEGMLPDAPAAIQGKKFDVRYSSLIARAQRVNEAQNISRALQILEPLSKVMPEVLQIPNPDKLAREVWTIFGNKHGLLFTAKEVADKRKALQQQQAKFAQQQQEQHNAELANKTAPMVSALQSQGGQSGGITQ